MFPLPLKVVVACLAAPALYTAAVYMTIVFVGLGMQPDLLWIADGINLPGSWLVHLGLPESSVFYTNLVFWAAVGGTVAFRRGRLATGS